MNFLLKHNKLIVLILSVFNIGWCIFCTLQDNIYSSLSNFIIFQLLIVIAYSLFSIYLNWLNHQLVNINSVVQQNKKLIEKNITASNQIAQLVTHIDHKVDISKEITKSSFESFAQFLEESSDSWKEYASTIDSILNTTSKLNAELLEVGKSMNSGQEIIKDTINEQNDKIEQNILGKLDLIEESGIKLQKIHRSYLENISTYKTQMDFEFNSVNQKIDFTERKLLKQFEIINNNNREQLSKVAEIEFNVLEINNSSNDILRSVREEIIQSDWVLEISHFFRKTDEQSVQLNEICDKLVTLDNKSEIISSEIYKSQEEVSRVLNEQKVHFEKSFEAINSLEKENGSLLVKSTEIESSLKESIRENWKSVQNQREFIKFELKQQLEDTYTRIDSLNSIYNFLNVKHPLPTFNDWKVNSDYASKLILETCNTRGGNIIDIGSGVSTIVIGYTLKKLKVGKVIALEHSQKYYEESKEMIQQHDLEEYCEVLYAPLKTQIINGREWKWYDFDLKSIPNDLALISIDGPPGNVQKLARYPALPVLWNKINKRTKILLDDGNRPEEEELIELWSSEFDLKIEKESLNKGYFYITKA